MLTVKVVVIGLPNSGKTSFVEAIPHGGNAPSPDKPSGLDRAVDFKRWSVDAQLRVQFYGIMGQRSLEFTWDTMCKGLSGAIVVVDSTDSEALPAAQHIIEFLSEHYTVPIVVAANKQDAEHPLSPEDLRVRLGAKEGIPIVPCVATKWASVKQVLLVLLYALRGQLEHPGGGTARFKVPR